MPSALPPDGGALTVHARVPNQAVCQLGVLSHQRFPVIWSHAARPCSGRYTAKIVVGPNPTAVRRTIAFALNVRSGNTDHSERFYAYLAPAGSSPTARKHTGAAGAATTMTTTTTTTTTTVPIGPQADLNTSWAGYVVVGSSYTSAAGTFNVPELTQKVPSQDVLDVWVGVGGFNDGPAPNLLQAGIMVSTLPCQGPAIASTQAPPGSVFACPWTFDIQKGQMVTGPIPDISVSPGDSITVTLRQDAGQTWTVTLSNNTTGQTWQNTMIYSGYGGSAEWVVEDPGMPGQGCAVDKGGFEGQCPMPPFSTVDFSGMQTSPSGSLAQYAPTLILPNGPLVAQPCDFSPSTPPVSSFAVPYAVSCNS